MNSHVRFEDEADAEYRNTGRWYEDRRAGLGLEFIDAVDEAVRQIVDLPRAGERVPRLPAELPVRRLAVKRFPYHVFYVEAPPGIRILAVAHDRRKPGYWKNRLKWKQTRSAQRLRMSRARLGAAARRLHSFVRRRGWLMEDDGRETRERQLPLPILLNA